MPECDGFVFWSSLVLSGLQLNPLENGDRFPRAELQFRGNLTNDGLIFNLPHSDDWLKDFSNQRSFSSPLFYFWACRCDPLVKRGHRSQDQHNVGLQLQPPVLRKHCQGKDAKITRANAGVLTCIWQCFLNTYWTYCIGEMDVIIFLWDKVFMINIILYVLIKYH